MKAITWTPVRLLKRSEMAHYLTNEVINDTLYFFQTEDQRSAACGAGPRMGWPCPQERPAALARPAYLVYDAFGDAQSRCYSLMGEFAHIFKTQHSSLLPGD